MNKKLLTAAFALLLSACSNQADLKGKTYELLAGQNGTKVVLEFSADDNKYSGEVVNRYFGEYEVDGKKIKFNPAGVTMMMGTPQDMEAEHNYLQILPRIVSYRIEGNNLILITDKGLELGFKQVK